MSNALVVFKKRTNVVTMDLGMDVSSDSFFSEVRTKPGGDLIVSWEVGFVTNGEDGLIVLSIDESNLEAVDDKRGVMDVKRVSSGEPLPVFDDYITVLFKDPVTE